MTRDEVFAAIAAAKEAGVRVDLSGASLYGANLTRANLAGANLDGATLTGANLARANLTGANLTGADLYEANLTRANLDGATLAGANLTGAVLYGANLTGANLDGAGLPAPPVVLLAQWGEVSDELCADLMAYDAANHPDPDRFVEWAASPDGRCPYDGVLVERSANFKESRSLYQLGRPMQSAYQLMVRLIAEKCVVEGRHDTT